MNKKTIIVTAGLLALLCAVLLGIYFTTKSAQEQLEAPGEFTFTDDNEAQITLHTKDPRVVSLVSSYTEIWLDGGGKLVGVTNDAITERDFGLTEQTCQPVGTTHEPNLELIISLQPNLVLLNPAQESHVSAQPILQQSGIACAYFEVEELEDYLRVLKIVTDLYETPQRYEEKGLAAQKLVEQIKEQAQTAKTSPNVLVLRAYGTGVKVKAGEKELICRMLDDLGAQNIADKTPSLLEELSLEVIVQEDPDAIFIVTMGSDAQAIQAVIQSALYDQPAWQGLTAVKENRVYQMPKDLFHYKPNSRWGESYEYLARLLYPDLFEA